MSETQKQMLEELNTSSINVLNELNLLGYEYVINDGKIVGIYDNVSGKEL